MSSRDSRSSGQPRSWSASVRNPSLAIPPTLPGRPAARLARDEPGRAAPRSRHRRRSGPRGQRGRLPRRAAGLRRRRRHGRPRGRRRRQPDRGRGVRPARRARATTRAAGPRSWPRRSRPARRGSRSTARAGAGPRPRRHAGTTVVAALLVEDDGGPKWLLANLGDSRIYRFADGGLEQVSVDHSVVQELVDAGEITADEAADHPERHVITRALGGPEARAGRLLPAAAGRGRAAAALLRRRHRDDRRRPDRRDPRPSRRPARRRRPAGRGGGRRPAARTTPPRSWSMWWDWCPTSAYDSERQRESLEQKLGALP